MKHFLRDMVRKSARLRLILDAHASVAFLAGTVLDVKSSVEVHLVQKGRVSMPARTAALRGRRCSILPPRSRTRHGGSWLLPPWRRTRLRRRRG
ncbi:MAG: SAVED domain-containing protein [Rhodobacteraceae bacterium]|nr:SAVED domain-containing protein [Paracoccaceae bacterium]